MLYIPMYIYIYIYSVATLPGNLRKVRDYENWPTNQGKVKEFYNIDWLAIVNWANFTSMLKTECVEFSLESHTYDLLVNSRKFTNYLLSFHFRRIPPSLISYCEILKTLHCLFRIFGFFNYIDILNNKYV